MLNAICASKLYRASTRKDKILAAFQDPINSELVGQLARALDEEYQTPEYLVKEPDTTRTSDSEPAVDSNDTASAEPTDSPVSVSHSSPSPAPASGLSPDDSPTSEDTPSEPDDSPEANSLSDQLEPDLIQESTTAEGKPVTASRARNMFRDMKQVSDQVKGMLNLNQTTSGVSRILCKENEFWIYYNDDVNLNNVMAEVIELLNISGYPYLEFNRLARSDNAIVFQIQFQHGIMQMNVASSFDQ